MDFARASLSQPHWVYQPGIAFDGLMTRCRSSRGRVARRNCDVAASVARTPDDLRAAATLVESRYAERGYRLSGDDGGAPRPGATLIAAERDAIVGTVTLNLDGRDGLAADRSYAEVIDSARRAGRTVCELTRLALTADGDSRPVLAALFGGAYLVGRRLHRVTDLFIEVNPRHARFYRVLFGFAQAAGERLCPRVMAPAVLLRLEIERLEARLGTLARAAVSPRALHQAPA
jgi:hypothetical protein